MGIFDEMLKELESPVVVKPEEPAAVRSSNEKEVSDEQYCNWLETIFSWVDRHPRFSFGGGNRRKVEDGQCRRCGCRETVVVLIHGGKSERLDCAKCGAFVAFGRWSGSDLQAVEAT